MSQLRRLSALVVTALALAAVLVMPLAASAAPPEHWEEPVDDTFPVSDVCAFTYTQTLLGTVKGTTFFDEEGNPTREVVQFHADGTFSANGLTVPFIIRLTDHVTYHADGSVTVITTGVIGRAVVPGQGLVGATIGRLRLTFGPEGGEPTVEFLAGQENEEEFFGTILCDLLTPE